MPPVVPAWGAGRGPGCRPGCGGPHRAALCKFARPPGPPARRARAADGFSSMTRAATLEVETPDAGFCGAQGALPQNGSVACFARRESQWKLQGTVLKTVRRSHQHFLMSCRPSPHPPAGAGVDVGSDQEVPHTDVWMPDELGRLRAPSRRP